MRPAAGNVAFTALCRSERGGKEEGNAKGSVCDSSLSLRGGRGASRLAGLIAGAEPAVGAPKARQALARLGAALAVHNRELGGHLGRRADTCGPATGLGTDIWRDNESAGLSINSRCQTPELASLTQAPLSVKPTRLYLSEISKPREPW